MTELTITYTHILQPDYYRDFRCLASDCPDTCCKGWVIEIDSPTYEKWQQLSKSIGSEVDINSPMKHVEVIPLRNQPPRYQIRMNEKMECPMLTEDGLCSLVLSHGHPMTTRICQDYPRQTNEYENLLQRAVSVRCAAVLDLLWKKNVFQYEIIETNNQNLPAAFPAKALLDGFLSFGNQTSVSSASCLFLLFNSIYQMHRKLELAVPCDSNGIRDYGMEMLTKENIQEVLNTLSASDPFSLTGCENERDDSFVLQESFEKIFHSCHDMMYDLMQNFFDSPVFGPDFHELFYQSRQIMENPDLQTMEIYLSNSFLSPEIDQKMKLLILEELFTSVLSTEVQDYESILVRLQWLIMQYLVIRHILILDSFHGKEMDDARLMNRITRIFRVSDLPDIVKICFFDSGFRNWLWSPEQTRQLLLIYSADKDNK